MRPKRVLFVCTGNICRSPMAEGLARHLARARGLDLSFSSAGVAAPEGHPASDLARSVLAARGVDIGGHRARRLRPGILAAADLVVVMEEEHRLAVREMPEAALRSILLLSEWAGEPRLGPGVDDPIGGDRADYEEAATIIEIYIQRALDGLTGPADAPEGGDDGSQEGRQDMDERQAR
jgi:protein-tyrosine-phosphatase